MVGCCTDAGRGGGGGGGDEVGGAPAVSESDIDEYKDEGSMRIKTKCSTASVEQRGSYQDYS